MLASVGVLCCAKTEDMNFKEKCGSCCTVFGIGVLQLLLVACFLIGWIWSCIWGITFIGMSSKSENRYYFAFIIQMFVNCLVNEMMQCSSSSFSCKILDNTRELVVL